VTEIYQVSYSFQRKMILPLTCWKEITSRNNLSKYDFVTQALIINLLSFFMLHIFALSFCTAVSNPMLEKA